MKPCTKKAADMSARLQTPKLEKESGIAETNLGYTARIHNKGKKTKEVESLREELMFYWPKALGPIPSPRRRIISNYSHTILFRQEGQTKATKREEVIK